MWDCHLKERSSSPALKVLIIRDWGLTYNFKTKKKVLHCVGGSNYTIDVQRRETFLKCFWLNRKVFVCLFIVVGQSIWSTWGSICLSWGVMKGLLWGCWTCSWFWIGGRVWQPVVDLAHLASGAMRGLCVASLTDHGDCLPDGGLKCLSASEMPTAIKNLLSENKSFYSRPIWRSEPLGLWSFRRPGSRGKQMERTVRWDGLVKKVRNSIAGPRMTSFCSQCFVLTLMRCHRILTVVFVS